MNQTLNQIHETLTTLAENALNPELSVDQFRALFLQSLTINRQLLEQLESVLPTLRLLRAHVFGSKSERSVLLDQPGQLTLSGIVFHEHKPPAAPTPGPREPKPRAPRKPRPAPFEGKFFDESQVHKQIIHLPCPEIEGLSPDQYERIGEKVSYRLAQRQASYVLLEYVRDVYKVHATETIVNAPAPLGVLDHGRADVSFIAGTIVDKIAYHLPLNRIHQRLRDAGFMVSRQWVGDTTSHGIALATPIYHALLQEVRAGGTLLMDETPIKTGPSSPGKMKQAYFWPVLSPGIGVCFVYAPSRAHHHVTEILGGTLREDQVLITDGYGAYSEYAAKAVFKHALCWSHCRRYFVHIAPHDADARNIVDQIAAIYHQEELIKQSKPNPDIHRLKRQEILGPLVDQLFKHLEAIVLAGQHTAKSPLMRAIGYAMKRREGLKVFLNDPRVSLDTNEIERSIRPIAVGRKNWLFCWTELGAQQIAIAQSLISSCRMHGIDPYTYLVDVLQRINHVKAADVHLLTPRNWKTHFGDNPMGSAVT
jgi:transposase